MKKFDILRYLRRFFALVLAVTMAGTVVLQEQPDLHRQCEHQVPARRHQGRLCPGRHRHERGRDLFFQGHLAGHGEPWAAKRHQPCALPLHGGRADPGRPEGPAGSSHRQGGRVYLLPGRIQGDAGGGRQPGCELRPPGAGCHRQQLFHHLHGGICGAAPDHEPLQRPAEQRLRLLRVRGRAVGRHHRSAELSGG